METLEFSRDGDVAWLRMNRPEKLNSFTVQMWQEMRTLGREVQDDDSIREPPEVSLANRVASMGGSAVRIEL